MITLKGLTKRYGDVTAVDDLSLDIAPGKITGFLGPNGAGKSTTMRMIVGLDNPTAGEALVGGERYATLRHPLREIGALLDVGAVHPGRTARAHLKAMAQSNGIPLRRVGEMLESVGLDQVADRRAGEFSLGMSQRLGIANALLGDPKVLLFDEPINGLDLDGVRWFRGLMRTLAEQGRTVFVSSHLMSEMQITADQLVVIGKGRLIADAPMHELIAASPRNLVRVRGPEPAGLNVLRQRLAEAAFTTESVDDHQLIVTGATIGQVGDMAYEYGVRLHELCQVDASLEQAYLELTGDSVEYGRSVQHGAAQTKATV